MCFSADIDFKEGHNSLGFKVRGFSEPGKLSTAPIQVYVWTAQM